MSLVENLINQISTKGLGSITSPQGFDLEDDTFSKLLDKSMANSQQSPNVSNFVGEMGMPAGLIIEPLDGSDFANTVQDQMEILGQKIPNEPISTEPFEMKDISIGDYFSSLLKTETNENSDFMNFAKKQATNFYGLQSKNLILDTREFIQDVLTS